MVASTYTSSTPWSLKQEYHHEFKSSLNCMARPCLKKTLEEVHCESLLLWTVSLSAQKLIFKSQHCVQTTEIMIFFLIAPSRHSPCFLYRNNSGTAWDSTLHRPAHPCLQYPAGPRMLCGFQWTAPPCLQCASSSKSVLLFSLELTVKHINLTSVLQCITQYLFRMA